MFIFITEKDLLCVSLFWLKKLSKPEQQMINFFFFKYVSDPVQIFFFKGWFRFWRSNIPKSYRSFSHDNDFNYRVNHLKHIENHNYYVLLFYILQEKTAPSEIKFWLKSSCVPIQVRLNRFCGIDRVLFKSFFSLDLLNLPFNIVIR